MRSPLCLSSRFRRNQDPISIALTLVLLAGCGGGDGIILPNEGEPAAIAVVEGDNQRGLVGEPLANPLVVEVTDTRGRPVSGATVAFEFSSSGAGASVVPEQKTTDADGRAGTTLVLGTSTGRQTGQARVVQTGTAAILAPFSAMALPENANTMAAVAGQDQTGHVGQELDDRLVVEVTDNFGNPVAGVVINWAATGGGSVSAAEVATDEDGRSRVDRILGPAVGQQGAVASAEGLAGSPVTFTHTALAGDASRLTIISGNDQTAEAGTALPDELVVRLIDADGNGVPGTAISWVVATGGGAASPEITTTDGEGRSSSRWTLGPALGQQRLDAVVSGVGVASFQATAASSAPPSLFIRTQPSGSARNGVPLGRQPVIQLRDAQGNDVSQAGVLITAAIGSGGGELGGDRQVVTDASGRATFSNLSISGAPGPRTLIFTATGYAQVTSDDIVLEAIGTSTTITGDLPDPSGVGAAFTVSFQVASSGPTPTDSVTVSDGVQSCRGPLANGAGSCQLALTTVGTRTLTATYAGEAGLSGSSGTEPHTVQAVAPPPPAGTTTTVTDTPDPSVAGSSFTVSFQVTSAGRTPTGSVTVRAVNGPECTDSLTGGSGSCQLTLNNPGDRTLIATYSGGPGFSGSSATEPHRVDPRQPDNEAPLADFNWHCEGLTCSFTDNSSDRNVGGTITRRHWDFGDGTTADDVLNPEHTYSTPGDRQVILTVTDNGSPGLTDDATDVVEPQVLTFNRQPSGSAAPGEPLDQQPRIQIRAGGRDADAGGVTVTAGIASGGGTLGGNSTATTDGRGRADFTNLSITGGSGQHTLRFTAVGFAEVVSDPVDVGKANSTVTLTAPDPSQAGQPFLVSVTVTGGPTPTGQVNVTASGPGTIRSCPITLLSDGPGSCELNLDGDGTITGSYLGDGLHNSATGQISHGVLPSNRAPTAAFIPSCADLTCAFNSSRSTDPDGEADIVSRKWVFENGTPSTSTDPNPPSVVFASGGDKTVTLTVTDNAGATDTETQQIAVSEPVTPPPPQEGE